MTTSLYVIEHGVVGQAKLHFLHVRALWLDMIIAQSDAHNFDAALNNNSLQPVGPRSVEAFRRTDVDSTDYDLLLVELRSLQRSHNCVGTSRTSIC